MGNPSCPKCGNLMQQKKRIIESYTDERNITHYGLSKFWICPKHSNNKYKIGGATIDNKT